MSQSFIFLGDLVVVTSLPQENGALGSVLIVQAMHGDKDKSVEDIAIGIMCSITEIKDGEKISGSEERGQTRKQNRFRGPQRLTDQCSKREEIGQAKHEGEFERGRRLIKLSCRLLTKQQQSAATFRTRPEQIQTDENQGPSRISEQSELGTVPLTFAHQAMPHLGLVRTCQSTCCYYYRGHKCAIKSDEINSSAVWIRYQTFSS
ncbi:uncharacterized protein LOC103176588 [Callorhinchus milii]|uniref:uncharacterized protein LOC103176588 n=1 Tax=Callorhinchus milii TaxID=7868 RepID=UPI001C3F8B11|nr:uncharacterized protein LOC103176588 [Callorhinchus milii]